MKYKDDSDVCGTCGIIDDSCICDENDENDLENVKIPKTMRGIDETKLSTGKYGAKTQQDFPDPIVRCDSCADIVHRQHIHQFGCCPNCGNRRFRNVLILKETEMEKLRDDGIDPEFLALFEGARPVDIESRLKNATLEQHGN